MARFADFGPPVTEYLRRLKRDEQIHCSPVEWLEGQIWSSKRIVLIGDAAHASSPLMGQGGCLAMEDALILAESLRSEPNLEAALRAFVERRTPRVNWVQQQSRAIADSFRFPPAVRDAIFRERGDAAFRQRFGPLVAPA